MRREFRHPSTLLLAVTALCMGGIPYRAHCAVAISSSIDELAPVGDFLLSSARGEKTSLHAPEDGYRATVLAFTAVECPIAKLYAPRLARLERVYRGRGVRFLGIDPNVQDAPATIVAHANDVGWEFPVLLDPLQVVTDRLGVDRTTEVLVLDDAYRVRYRGALDDQYGVGTALPEPRNTWLVDALEAVLDDSTIETPRTDAPGCLIGRVLGEPAPDAITFFRDVAPIVWRECVDCHRPGQIGPMSFLDASRVRGWAPMMSEVVRERRMPPWHADPRYGSFDNARRLTDTEIATIEAWAMLGAPLGDPDQAPEPPADETEGWSIGEPDLVVTLPEEQSIPPEGTVDYRYVVVDPGLTEDRWAQAIEVRPSNRAVTHHVLVLAVPPDQTVDSVLAAVGNAEEFIKGGYFAVDVPGSRAKPWPEGMGKFVEAGTQFLFQLHYTPNGEPATDRSTMGFRWATAPVTRPVQTRGIANVRLDIPPGVAHDEYTAAWVATEPIEILEFFPHLHARGKSFRVELWGEDEDAVLLDVPRYDFNWQHFYRFRTPPRVAEGDTIFLTAAYDNSADNPMNPDPTDRVQWGDQTWEEMMIGYFDYVAAEE